LSRCLQLSPQSLTTGRGQGTHKQQTCQRTNFPVAVKSAGDRRLARVALCARSV
jgi:hypothetical protein